MLFLFTIYYLYVHAGCQDITGPVPSYAALYNNTDLTIYTESVYSRLSDKLQQSDNKVSFTIGAVNCHNSMFVNDFIYLYYQLFLYLTRTFVLKIDQSLDVGEENTSFIVYIMFI